MNSISSIDYCSMLPMTKLRTLADENKDTYASALPFSHIAFDDVFDEKILDEVLNEFERSDEWKEFETEYEKKFQMSNDEKLGPYTRALIHQLNSAPFLEFLETLTGIKGLIPDPYLTGGGLHKIPRGGKLGIHVDFNQYKKINAYRRINILIYLNKDWKDEYGGFLELWKDNKGTMKQKIAPLFNKMAIFSTVSNSYHGHPEPLNCPEDRCRRSLALYYYTAGDMGGQRSEEHSTIFISDKGKEVELGKETFMGRVKGKVKKLLNI